MYLKVLLASARGFAKYVDPLPLFWQGCKIEELRVIVVEQQK